MMLMGHGVYSFREASWLTGLKTARVREWFTSHQSVNHDSIFESDFAGKTSQQLISFLDLVDVFVAGQMREHGVSLQTLRRVYKTLEHDQGLVHPFSRRELLTDGRRVFVAGLDEQGREEVFDALTRQKAFPNIILPFLKKLDFDSTSSLARRWRIARGIVVDPTICFGQPVVEAKGIPTRIIANAMEANEEDASIVADWYGMSVAQVKSAYEFEHRLAS